MRVLVTGSRDWPAPGSVGEALISVASETRDSSLTVVHGGARGADTIAHNFCVAYPCFGNGVWVVEEVHRPSWSAQGKSAGMWRNRRMVDSGIGLVLAFIKDESRGATHCLEYATKAGVPSRVWRLP